MNTMLIGFQVHSLIPWPHRPTFLERMKRRDDQHDPLFFALIMSVLAASIVQVRPATCLPMSLVSIHCALQSY